MVFNVCAKCGQIAVPIEEPREEKLPGGGVKVYGTLCVCACDPRHPSRASKRGEVND